MKKTTQVIESGCGVCVVFEDGSVDRLSPDEFINRFKEFEQLQNAGIVLMHMEDASANAVNLVEYLNLANHYAQELDSVCAGRAARCSACGAIIDAAKFEEIEREDEDGDKITFYRCSKCGDERESEPGSIGLSEYLYYKDAGIHRIILDGGGEYVAAQFILGCFGPTVVADTVENSVIVYYNGSCEARAGLLSDTINTLDEYAATIYESEHAPRRRW